jgi:hypothetical protein
MIYLVVLLCMVNMGVQVEICAMKSFGGEQQQKTNDFLRHFILFERHLFAAHF